jgi:[NiFe] hydrogenase small subunit
MAPENVSRIHQKPVGQSRREFLKFFSTVATAIGLGPEMGSQVLEALAAPGRPPVLWLHFAECTGCTESVLRTTNPWLDDLIFSNVSLDYHETLMAPSGAAAEDILFTTATQFAGRFLCVVEGSVPTANNGTFGMIGNRSMLSIAQEVCPKAKAVITIGTCSSYGGLAAAAPNPTGAFGVKEALGNSLTVPVVKVPGCPPNPVNFVGTLANYVLKGALPPLDSLGRPLFAYGTRVHDRCPYHEGALEYRCLEDIGCKGKQCWNNCPTVKFNDGTNWPVGAGHPCIGCSQPNFWDTMTPFYVEVDD